MRQHLFAILGGVGLAALLLLSAPARAQFQINPFSQYYENVARAAKRANTGEGADEAVGETRDDRASLIAELRAERDAAVKVAAEAAQEAEAEAWLTAKRAAEAAGEV